MEGCGTITLHVEETASRVIIEVTDTGKGIKKKNIRNVFKPGFTTKTWLGPGTVVGQTNR